MPEEVCGPILERVSGLKCGVDFTLGYSPERINPGDKLHRLEAIVKVVSGQDSAPRVAAAYGAIVEAGAHRAPSIAVAEAAKVIENTQRDLKIALMNELHLGAQSHVRVSFDLPEYTGDITGLGAVRLLEAIRRSGILCRLYQASSSEMFGDAPATPRRRSDGWAGRRE